MTYRHHMILDACFNITSDAVMLCLPIPLVIKAKVPPMRKVALVGVFSLGGLVVGAQMCSILEPETSLSVSISSDRVTDSLCHSQPDYQFYCTIWIAGLPQLVCW